MLDNHRIAIIRLSSIGDVLHATPVARALKTAAPSCYLTWIVGEVAADLVKCNPFIDEVYVWSRERWEAQLRHGQFRAALAMWRQLKNKFSAQPCDIALDVQGLFLSGMVTAATGAPRRIGLGRTKEPNGLFMTEKAAEPQSPHVIRRYLSVLKPLDIATEDYQMTLCIPPAAARFAGEFLAGHGITPRDKVIVFIPSTTWPAKNWPPEYFAAAIDGLADGGRLILCGGPGDRGRAAEISAMAKTAVIDATGKTSLLEMGALLARAQVVVTGDTGPLHMAIALGTPTVSLFGPTDPAMYGPLQPGHIVLNGYSECKACHKRVCPRRDAQCMKIISPRNVIHAVQCQLDRGGEGPFIRRDGNT